MKIEHIRPDTGEVMGTMSAFKWMFRYLSWPVCLTISDGRKYAQAFKDVSYLGIGEELTMPGGTTIRRIR